MASSDACLLCDSGPLMPVLDVADVPALCNALYDEADAAQRAPRGQVDLRICSACGAGRNVAFDPAVVAYDTSYENSLHFSPSFQGFARDLAERLADTYDLSGGTALEIGCGKGEFLSLLCDVAGCAGVGYDPTFEGEVPEGAPYAVHRTLFPATPGELRADLVVCRHVLEHLDDPRAVLRTLRSALGPSSTTPAYAEVPGGEYMFTAPALWDVIYEHPWYYTKPALRHLFEITGFEVTACEATFSDQFLGMEARPATAERDGRAERRGDVAGVVDEAAGFGKLFKEAVDRWDDALRGAAGEGPVVVWGAGSKGATFLNVVPAAMEHVVAAVDVNPRKAGRFVAGTGHPIVAPERLGALDPALVIVMNPVYVDEVEGLLASAGVQTRVEIA